MPYNKGISIIKKTFVFFLLECKMALKDLSLSEFLATTASDSPAPGGGSVSALCGALAASLAQMVAALTVGKKGYEGVAPECEKALTELTGLRTRLLDAIDEDAKGFSAFMDAMALPKGTPEEKAVRSEAMQAALKSAALIPLEVAKVALSVMPYAKFLAANGNKNAVTYALVSAMCARTAVLGALLNVEINLGGIRDEAFVADTRASVASLRASAVSAEREILDSVTL